jgi:hypothetical protein
MESVPAWIDPPLAAWARANAQLEAERVRQLLAAGRALDVDADDIIANLHTCLRRLTADQKDIVAAQIYE